MDLTTILILSAILVFFFGNRASEWLNVLASGQPVPDQLGEIYKPDQTQRSREYLKRTAQFALAKNSVALACLLVFWFAGGFPVLDNFARSLGLSTLVTGTLFVVGYVMAVDLLKLPFHVYETKMQRAFGLGTTTTRLFFADYAKNFLGRLLMLPWPVFGILWIFEKMGSDSFLFVWLFVSVVGVFIQDVFLPLLGPLFNTYRRLEDGELRSAIARYAEKVQFPCRDILVIDSSKRSTVAGAMLRGFGKRKDIVLTDNLINRVTADEAVAVVAVTIGRERAHSKLLALVGTVSMIGVMFYLISLFVWEPKVFEAFGVQPSIYLGLIFFSMVFPPVELGFSIVRNYVSRRTQTKADAFATGTIDNRGSLVSALKKLSVTSLASPTPHAVYVLLNHPRPPLAQRLQRIGHAM